MSSWSQKKQLIVIGAGAFVVCLAAGGGVYYTQGLIDEVEARIESKRQEIAAAEATIKKIPAAEDEVIILRENLDDYVKILPDDKKLNDFIRMIAEFERQTGIVGTGLKPKKGRTTGKQRFEPIEYSYEMTATLWQFLKFLNLVENFDRFVSVVDFDIKSGAKGRDAQQVDGETVHQVKLTLQTYKYNEAPTGKEVAIANYEKRKSELREEIWKRLQETKINIETYDYRDKQGRRDILVDPRLTGDGSDGAGTTRPVQEQVLQRYVTEVARLKEMADRLKNPETTLFEQYGLEKGVREGLAAIEQNIDSDFKVLTFAPFKLQWSKNVSAPLDEIRVQMNTVAESEQKRQDPYLPRPEIEALLADMAADLKSGQLEDAKGRYDVVASRLAMPSTDARYELAVKAKALQVKAATALAFREMDLKLDGVVVNRGGRSGVLLNGEVYEEGEYVTDDLLVKMVEEEQVWFVFRGLTLVRTM